MFQEIPKNCRYGYVRVSSKSQEENSSLESQKKKLLRQGVPEKNIRLEIGSAADPIRERLVFCIDMFSRSFHKCRFLVTCRPYAYRDPNWQLVRFASDEIAEFQQGQIISFIECWHQQFPTADRVEATARGQQLQIAVLGRPALKDLAKRPLLLNIIVLADALVALL